jgi:peroxiredoxin Q/BCP
MVSKKMTILEGILNHIWLILFLTWGMPLGYYRSKFRKKVYKTDHWIINIKPVFLKELKALFGNLYPKDNEYIRLRDFYRIYLSVYFLLFFAYQLWG